MEVFIQQVSFPFFPDDIVLHEELQQVDANVSLAVNTDAFLTDLQPCQQRGVKNRFLILSESDHQCLAMYFF